MQLLPLASKLCVHSQHSRACWYIGIINKKKHNLNCKTIQSTCVPIMWIFITTTNGAFDPWCNSFPKTIYLINRLIIFRALQDQFRKKCTSMLRNCVHTPTSNTANTLWNLLWTFQPILSLLELILQLFS